ncbi:MAG: peptidoglycan-binding protein [Acetatifactor sp.]|nr:peptidoglycan-binding protein [Acetatifactor sp.]MDE7113649.1 peptidoglycan-binding protein [Acetatifactor sp.]
MNGNSTTNANSINENSVNENATNENADVTGTLQVNVVSSLGLIPVENAKVIISYEGDPENPLETLTTDSSGQTPSVKLPAPPIEYSLDPDTIVQPYSEYNITVIAEGYEPVQVSGSELLPDRLSLQPIVMNPLETSEEDEKRVIIPVHTLFGDYPPKIPEEEIKPMSESGEIVLSRVVVPEYVIVHDGVPSDSTASNYWVRYKDYIKNVASCEIYSTWPEAAIYANILAIMSFTLNRVYTEWYRNQGYNFTITSSTAYDQKWIYGRNIFQNIDYLVDTIFANYLARPGVRQPIFTSYCDGNRVTCNGLSQWGSKYLADEGYSAIEIIRYYFGNDMYIATADIISGVPSSYPGYDLNIGASGDKVRQLQLQLNRIARNYPAIPTLTPDGVYGPATAESVRIFQGIFGLPQTGVTDYATWYEVSDIYVGVTRISEPG